ncbi:hypothetical protein [Brasilonema sp. UFV-L1]|uniref:hypothetical protein n=1 Tax=Brasilonema sp. UFV-L1 TaxID=2234130 RepID=UPI00145DC960|nr:hypothetical protein [Brasilonema sp. UFV-L1]NMG11088.1 hypothetical protein [Brasilonema sp. UFV-L1]
MIEIQISVEQATELEMLLRLLGTMGELPVPTSREKLSAFARSPRLTALRQQLIEELDNMLRLQKC